MELSGLLHKLKFDYLPDQLDSVCEQTATKDLGYREFLLEVLSCEWAGRHQKGLEGRLKQARLPWLKSLEQFDFSFQPSIDRKVIRELASLAFVERAENVILLGPPGVGKTHLAIALGVKAAEAGQRVLFLTLDTLMTKLKKAQQENRLERQLQQWTYPKVLIIDEIGFLPLDRQEASLFFRLVARRYEKAATVLTSNKGFVDWGEVFADQVIATAILDRLLHHATTINIKGESFRLKEKRKAGLLNSASASSQPLTPVSTSGGLNYTKIASLRTVSALFTGHLKSVKCGLLASLLTPLTPNA